LRRFKGRERWRKEFFTDGSPTHSQSSSNPRDEKARLQLAHCSLVVGDRREQVCPPKNARARQIDGKPAKSCKDAPGLPSAHPALRARAFFAWHSSLAQEGYGFSWSLRGASLKTSELEGPLRIESHPRNRISSVRFFTISFIRADSGDHLSRQVGRLPPRQLRDGCCPLSASIFRPDSPRDHDMRRKPELRAPGLRQKPGEWRDCLREGYAPAP